MNVLSLVEKILFSIHFIYFVFVLFHLLALFSVFMMGFF